MKTRLLLLALLCSLFSYGQIPTGYYSTTTGTGYTLKTQLYNKIKGHTDPGYNGLWTTYATSDRDNQYENDNSIIDIYSENPTGTDPYKFTLNTNQCGTYSVEGDCYNREHIIPQSTFGSAAPMVSDAHHIPPTDGKVNGIRSNYPHGNVATASTTTRNGSKLGTSAVSGYTGTVFEPINEFKGDIARMYFYFATRYENTVSGYTFDMFNGTSNQVFTTAFLDMLKTWHTNDPVSAREIARNNAIYARQGNRNPYIDHPEYIASIWGGSSDTSAPSAPTSVIVGTKTTTSIALSWTASTDNIAVTGYDVYQGTTLKTSVTSTSATITGLVASTSYSFSIKAKDAAGNISVSSSSISATTNAVATSTSTELFFTEYLEGSSNNKALEISNKTASSISLSVYSIKKQSNGAGSWSTGITLSGTLASNAKFVIVNSLISSTCYSTSSANLSSSGAEMTFNGNDAVGLFKNGTLIDIIGTFNGGTANFSIDETIRRKSTVTRPTITFNKSTQWDVFATDTCTGIGNRMGNGSEIKDITNIDFNIYPNPSNGNFTIDFKSINATHSIEIYSLIGQKVFENENTDSTVSVSNLQKGIYLIKVTKGAETIMKKIVIN
ncbi:endonuclease [Flavobacterium sp.]|uniref:endonuclease n=1 Tax=Flavobacterium sp. TaxID=239 RepID=UPI00286D71CC|nr:endonuclease [Flavobacterium sp.]